MPLLCWPNKVNCHCQNCHCHLNFSIFFLCFADRQDNFPPIPSCLPCKPCFFQDFSVDIPLEFQRIVKIMYYLWLCECSVLYLFFVLYGLFLSPGVAGCLKELRRIFSCLSLNICLPFCHTLDIYGDNKFLSKLS